MPQHAAAQKRRTFQPKPSLAHGAPFAPRGTRRIQAPVRRDMDLPRNLALHKGEHRPSVRTGLSSQGDHASLGSMALTMLFTVIAFNAAPVAAATASADTAQPILCGAIGGGIQTCELPSAPPQAVSLVGPLTRCQDAVEKLMLVMSKHLAENGRQSELVEGARGSTVVLVGGVHPKDPTDAMYPAAAAAFDYSTQFVEQLAPHCGRISFMSEGHPAPMRFALRAAASGASVEANDRSFNRQVGRLFRMPFPSSVFKVEGHLETARVEGETYAHDFLAARRASRFPNVVLNVCDDSDVLRTIAALRAFKAISDPDARRCGEAAAKVASDAGFQVRDAECLAKVKEVGPNDAVVLIRGTCHVVREDAPLYAVPAYKLIVGSTVRAAELSCQRSLPGGANCLAWQASSAQQPCKNILTPAYAASLDRHCAPTPRGPA